MAKLSIIVPVFNEESNLTAVVNRLVSANCPVEREFIFVDDCSSDQSLSILKGLAERHSFRVIEQKTNCGKGVSVRKGIQEATGDYIMIHDADFEYDPNDIPELIKPLLENRADAVYGSRFKEGSPQVHRTYHYFINKFLTFMSNVLSGIYLTDMETCYKVFRADLVKSMNLRSKRFGIEIELTAYLAKIRARTYEVPISYFPRTRLQGKKITWLDGVAAIFHLIRFNLFTPLSAAYTNLPERYLHAHSPQSLP